MPEFLACRIWIWQQLTGPVRSHISDCCLASIPATNIVKRPKLHGCWCLVCMQCTESGEPMREQRLAGSMRWQHSAHLGPVCMQHPTNCSFSDHLRQENGCCQWVTVHLGGSLQWSMSRCSLRPHPVWKTLCHLQKSAVRQGGPRRHSSLKQSLQKPPQAASHATHPVPSWPSALCPCHTTAQLFDGVMGGGGGRGGRKRMREGLMPGGHKG